MFNLDINLSLFYKLYEIILNNINYSMLVIMFGSVSNQVSEQLFSPLLFQVIHWFTGKAKYKSAETVVLLDALLVCVVYCHFFPVEFCIKIF